ncbi:hypothetical protein [Tunturiibacter gelidiferens]|uniref:Uncharacterized protein n=1 Tax=Tunturiibacter gelidiferens TaxID=3069689 RepID=A0AAU7YVG5_9BACT
MEALLTGIGLEGDGASDGRAFANPRFYLRMEGPREFAVVDLGAYCLVLRIQKAGFSQECFGLFMLP